mmetsp:Transcript_26131/g.42855  ORF Transcript_26131/g.42855 Transcript_26131/m.42855 type:complete len:202 (+) Transcript_26131:1109-1714(+)
MVGMCEMKSSKREAPRLLLVAHSRTIWPYSSEMTDTASGELGIDRTTKTRQVLQQDICSLSLAFFASFMICLRSSVAGTIPIGVAKGIDNNLNLQSFCLMSTERRSRSAFFSPIPFFPPLSSAFCTNVPTRFRCLKNGTTISKMLLLNSLFQASGRPNNISRRKVQRNWFDTSMFSLACWPAFLASCFNLINLASAASAPS